MFILVVLVLVATAMMRINGIAQVNHTGLGFVDQYRWGNDRGDNQSKQHSKSVAHHHEEQRQPQRQRNNKGIVAIVPFRDDTLVQNPSSASHSVISVQTASPSALSRHASGLPCWLASGRHSRLPSRLTNRLFSRLASRLPSRLANRLPSRLSSRLSGRLPSRLSSRLARWL